MDSSNARVLVERFATRRPRLRIAVVTETYPPEVNGVALSLARIVEGLRDRAHDVQLVRPRQSPSDVGATGERYHEVLLRGMAIPRYPDLKMGLPSRKALTALWTARRPDLVHIATEGPLGWSALQAATRLDLPVCSDFRTNFHAYSKHYGIGWLRRPIVGYLRGFHNRTACTMVPTEQLRAELEHAGFERLRVVTRGVDTQRFTPQRRSAALRETWGAGSETPVALFVGRVAPEKNLAGLAAAFHAMREVAPDARLVVVGDGPARHDLKVLVPDAVFAGTRSGDDLATHYASADAFVFPSMTETFGNVTTEAMASGLPVIAYRHAAAGQLIRSGENGLLAPLGDQAWFVEQAAQLFRDRIRAGEMGAAARRSACELGWDRVIGQVESAFFAAVHDTSASRSSRLAESLAEALPADARAG